MSIHLDIMGEIKPMDDLLKQIIEEENPVMVVQKVYSHNRRTLITVKLSELRIGFKKGQKFFILMRGNVLFFSVDQSYKGFDLVQTAVAGVTQGNIQGPVFKPWVESVLGGRTHIKAYYTTKGIFITPFDEKEFTDYVL